MQVIVRKKVEVCISDTHLRNIPDQSIMYS